MNTYSILNRRIPEGGRRLTSSECAALRRLGTACSPAWLVMPIAQGHDHLGVLYYPAPGGGYGNAGAKAGLKPTRS